MSLSGMVEIPRLEAKRGFVMPAQAGIHLRAHCKAKENLDSGFRRNNEKEESTSGFSFLSPDLETDFIAAIGEILHRDLSKALDAIVHGIVQDFTLRFD